MSSLLISLPQDSVIFLWVSISRRNLSHPDGNRFMRKTLQRFQRSGSKSNASILKVSFQRRRVSSHLWSSIKSVGHLHVNRQQWQSIARFSLAELNLLQSYQPSLRSLLCISCCVFRRDSQVGALIKSPTLRPVTAFRMLFWILSQEQKPTSYNKCLDIGREELLSGRRTKSEHPKFSSERPASARQSPSKPRVFTLQPRSP